MGVASDIVATYRAPRRVVRRLLASGQREDRALAVLMGACLLLFVAQWPVAARAAYLEPDVPLEARLASAFLASMFILPLFAYAVAGISHLAARAFGGAGTFWRARIALFWALLAAAPLQLLYGLVGGFIGPGAQLRFIGFVVFGIFILIWGAGLRVAEFEREGTDGG
ncbi:YIP1 family protein [Ostreiculturibacter nitratireducens]|uniref:YIP1 family protein n=1 Tax=Ostreiculturibacter nitratireducens TaxID=3075226 RepID=UPI0031B58D20